MRRNGSVTVFLALIMSLLVALVTSCLASAQMAAARVQIANAADIGLYSLFAQFDGYLLEEFNLFYLDAGYGRGELNLGAAYDEVVRYMEPVLDQNYQKLELKSGGITGYRLATDNRGASLKKQVTAYMRATLGTQGIQKLAEKVERGSGDVSQQQSTKDHAQAGNSIEDYDRVLAEAQEDPVGGGDDAGGVIGEEPGEAGGEVTVPAEPVENPIDTIREIKTMGVLSLVIPDYTEVSGKAADVSSLASHRTLQQGMGIFEGDAGDSSATDKILFQEYILQHVGNFRRPAGDGLLSYPLEYIIGEKGSDRENLEAVALRLMLIREGVNFVYLLGDGAKRAQAAALASAIAASLLVPVAEGLIEMVLLGCWAYGETLLDVRELFAGGSVALLKTSETWQLSLEKLPQILGRLDADRKSVENGMTYEDYLRVLLFLESEDEQTVKCMDALELTVRGREGHENFRMDSCLDAMEIAMDVRANAKKTYQVVRKYSYQ